MIYTFVRFLDVTFGYESSTEALFQNLTLHIASGWSGVVGRNGTGKTTLLKLATGLLEPIEGRIDRSQRAVYCSQRTDNAPEHLGELIAASTKSARIIKGQLGVQEDWAERWHTLSHGERKRAQLGVGLWLDPDVLAIDEPTNHVDAETRASLTAALRSYSGIGLLVSHDRALLDSLCAWTVFIDPPKVVCRRGGYTEGKRIAEEERKALQKQQELKKQAYKKLKREAGKRRAKANQADRKRSKRGIAKKDHDAKEKIDGVRLSGKDAVGGKLLRQLDGRLTRAKQELEGLEVKKEYALGIRLPGSQSKRDLLIELPEGALPLGNRKQLRHPRLFIQPDDRIGLTGRNGSGKSTLVRKLIAALDVSQDRITYVPQEIDIARSRDILAGARALPNDQTGHLMTIVSRLGSRPGRLLESSTPSPGETRKLLLALGMIKEPHIIIMDEPTNHMDLPSIECLEQALSECPCCLVLISHDQRFLEKLTHRRWHISRETEDTFCLEIIR